MIKADRNELLKFDPLIKNGDIEYFEKDINHTYLHNRSEYDVAKAFITIHTVPMIFLIFAQHEVEAK